MRQYEWLLIKSKDKRSIKLTINEKDIAQLEKNLHQKEYTKMVVMMNKEWLKNDFG